MIHLPLAAGVPFIMKLIAVIWVLTALLLIFIVLIQKGKGGGLSGAFGGLGAGGLLGTRTGDFLTWVTIGLVVAFLGIGIIMVKFYKPGGPADDTTPALRQADTPAPGGDTTTSEPARTGDDATPATESSTGTPPEGANPPAENTPAQPADK